MNESDIIPDEVFAPFEDFLRYLDEHDDVLSTHVRALKLVSGYVELGDAISSAAKTLGKDAPARDADEEARFEARCLKEVSSGFPHLMAHSVVLLWANFESAFEHFLANLIYKVPEVRSLEVFAKIKLSADLVIHREQLDIAYSVSEEMIRTLSGSSKWGLSRFDQVLDKLKMPMNVNQDVKTNLLEFVHTRNVIVHKRGVVDQKFIDSCPWMKVAVGEQLLVSYDDYRKYRGAVGKYVGQIIRASISDKYATVLGR